MNPGAVNWHYLNERILPKLDASWFAGAAQELVREARELPILRPWLWRAVAAGSGLKHLSGLSGDAGNSGHEGFVLDEQAIFPLLLELGALAHAVTIRTLVDRTSVLNLKEVLGAELYARALRLRAMPTGGTPPVDEAAVLRDPSTPLSGLRDSLQRQGAREAVSWLNRNDDHAGASLLTLRCPADWRLDRPGTALPDAVITVCWNDAMARFGGEPA